ncbi:MAG: tetratricopeptide repeat protein [Halobacteriota archaeon]|nr:tetratricopeptide repeat protein [Halobacteriota archaeon]
MKTPSETKANEWRQMREELRIRGVYDEAVKFFSKSIETNPLDYRTYVGLGGTYLRMKMFSEAKKYFEKSLPYAPDNFLQKLFSSPNRTNLLLQRRLYKRLTIAETSS